MNEYQDDEDQSSTDGSTSSYEEYDNNEGSGRTKSTQTNELKQHILAIIVAIFAAIITHAQLHGGFGVWKDELIKDLEGICSSLTGKGAASEPTNRIPRANDNAPHAAPSMDRIPAELRKKAVQKALSEEIGHARASSYRRMAGLDFCSVDSVESTSSTKDQLVYLDFILPLIPTVQVLHSYYLSDALGLDSSFVYDNVDSFGGFDSDIVLKEIDNAYQHIENNEEGLSLEQIRSILESRLDKDLVNTDHVCLLQQYTANKRSGRSIRGRTKAYKQSHISTLYQREGASTTENALSTSHEPNDKMIPASLTFTGFATKFINLSVQPLNLYWDGGHISTGPKAGQMHTSLVGTIQSMESIGTASFPGHSFFITPTYDKDHQLKRWTVTEDEAVIYYDPFEDLSTEDQMSEVHKLLDAGKLTLKQKFARDAWVVNRSFSRDYLVKTGLHWLSVFPQPFLTHLKDGAEATDDTTSDQGLPMWSADFLGQVHTIETSELYFTDVPSTLPRLTKDDFHADVEQQRRLELNNYKSAHAKGNAITVNSTMQLDLKAISVLPRVFEVKKFLSPVEVQHLIDLASGVKGDVSMQTSTVLASGIRDTNVKSASKEDTRSSTGGWIHREQDAIVDGIFRRVADLLDIDERMMRDQRPPHLIGADDNGSLPTHDRIVEAMQLLRYDVGEQYTAHHEFTYPSIENRYQPKRYATLLIYLTGEGDIVQNGVRRSRSKKSSNSDETTDGLVGGETTFPRAITTEFHDGIKIQPQSGKAVLFYNVLPDGNMDDLSQHSGGKVETGVKYVANIWIWDPIIS